MMIKICYLESPFTNIFPKCKLFSRSLKSPLLFTLVPVSATIPKLDAKAVILALERGRVPKMPVCPKRICG